MLDIMFNIPSDMGCLADGERVSPNGVWKVLQTKVLFTMLHLSTDSGLDYEVAIHVAA